jgi:hypothetical protein
MSTHARTLAKAWERCAAFNEAHPVGTKVKYRSLLDHETKYDLETVTRSQAWALNNGEPVVMLKDKAGGVSLDHVEVIGGVDAKY